MRLTFTLQGTPVSQGSMVRTSYGMRHAKPLAINVFRDQVATAVANTGNNELPLAGALSMSVTFVLPRPKSAPKRRIWPEVKPDLDKLVRALCDALTQCGAWVDDAQLIHLNAVKRYAGTSDVLNVPGVVVDIGPVEVGNLV
jgi:crossover junction endodeoxyribonuclease RusA